MKKFLLLISMLTALGAKAQTSVYHPMPESSAIWNFHHFQLMCLPGGSYHTYYSVTISGDTLINNQNYHKLEIPYIQYVINGICNSLMTSGYRGAFRQDTAMRKVFFIPSSENTEQLLYDFNMQVGDTVRGYLGSLILQQSWQPDTVIAIDSVLVGSSYHKRWKINNLYGIYLIEGVGSTYGLFQPSPGEFYDFDEITLTCFSQNGMTLYPDTNTQCQLITGIENIDYDNNIVTVTPNPFSNELSVTISRNEPSEFILYDITSRKIIQKQFTDFTRLNTEGLAKGVYIYQIINKKGILKKGKVVKE